MKKLHFTSPHCLANVERITAYIRTAGQTTSGELSRELELSPKHVNLYLNHMNRELRLIRKVAQNTRFPLRTIWTLGVEAMDGDAADRGIEPIRLTVKTWDGGVTQDPWALPSAFFRRDEVVA